VSDDDFETLGLLVDRLDNAAAATVLPVPTSILLEGMTGIVNDVRDELRSFLIERGFNPWEGHPA
jgi:hypothetical protein